MNCRRSGRAWHSGDPNSPVASREGSKGTKTVEGVLCTALEVVEGRRSKLSKVEAVEGRRDASRSSRMGDLTARFLNIDLEVRSRKSLAPLVAACPSSYQPLLTTGRANPRWLLVNPGAIPTTAEIAAKNLLRQIAGLRGAAGRSWKEAHRRVFDIGVEAGGPGAVFEGVRLTSETLRRISAVGASIQVTVYPAESERDVR